MRAFGREPVRPAFRIIEVDEHVYIIARRAPVPLGPLAGALVRMVTFG